MKYFHDYESARALGGWATSCRRSIYYPIPVEACSEDEASEKGYKPHRQVKNPTRFALVITSRTRGFKGDAAKVYCSVWAK
jgi:hypothetical protein